MAMIHTLKTAQEIEAAAAKIKSRRDFVQKEVDGIPGRIQALEKGNTDELGLDNYAPEWVTDERIHMLRNNRIAKLRNELPILQERVKAYDKRISQAQARIDNKNKGPKSSPAVDKDVAKRFLLFRRKYIDKSQNNAAMKMVVSQPSLSNVENGVIPPSSNLVNILQSKFNCNITWLLTGKGEPTQAPEDPSTIRKSMLQMQLDLQTADKRIEVLEANVNRLYKIVEKLAKE